MSERSARFAERARKIPIEQSHFNQRVRERLWPVFGEIDPMVFYQEVLDHLTNGHPNMSYVGRISRDGRRLWRLEMPPNGHCYVVAHHSANRINPMTVLMPGMHVGREGKSTIYLK